MTPEQIARVCHEANRAMTAIIGDVPVQPHWDEAPEEMKIQCVNGVLFVLENQYADPAALHFRWMLEKRRLGWEWGAEKNDALKQHPAMRPYDQLPPGTRLKDVLFRAVVHALKQKSDS